MAQYEVDRRLLETFSTDEILRILKQERDDYTEEAIAIFHEILQARGVDVRNPPGRARGAASGSSAALSASPETADFLVRAPSDAVQVLNHLLDGVIKGTIEPQAAQVASSIVMGILHAMEQEFMSESEEDQ